MRKLRSCSLFAFILGVQVFLLAQQHEPNAGAVEARKVIQKGNTEWGKARVAHDRTTFEKMLAPDFYVQLPDKKVSRQEFVDLISTRRPNTKLTRFDPIVLTVDPAGDGWEAVILERLESERTTTEGKSQKIFVLYVTKDKWQKIGEKWQIHSSAVVSNEMWTDNPPPLSLWTPAGP
jgi:hypothetical protein